MGRREGRGVSSESYIIRSSEGYDIARNRGGGDWIARAYVYSTLAFATFIVQTFLLRKL